MGLILVTPAEPAERWAAALDELEATVDAHGALAALGPAAAVELPPVDAAGLPDDLGPLPFELGDRARALAERVRLVQVALEKARDAVAGELTSLNARTKGFGRSHAEPSRIDDTV